MQRVWPTCSLWFVAYHLVPSLGTHLVRCDDVGSRGLRLLYVFVLATHWIGCLFYLVCRQPGARHYAGAPWRSESEALGSDPRAAILTSWCAASVFTSLPASSS